MPRRLAVKDIGERLRRVRLPLAFGLCGSSAMGFARKESDIDLWICIRRRDARALLSALPHSAKAYLEEPLKEFMEGRLDIYNIKASHKGMRCSIEIYSRASLKRICNLSRFKVRRWREFGTAGKRIGFKSAQGAIVWKHCSCDGWHSRIDNVLVRKGRVHYGQHIDRLCSSKIIIDTIHATDSTFFLWLQVLQAARGEETLTRFLFREERLPVPVRRNLNEKLGGIARKVAQCQASLKSMGTTS